MQKLLTVRKKEILRETLVESFRYRQNGYYYSFKNDNGLIITFSKRPLDHRLIMNSYIFDKGVQVLAEGIKNKEEFADAVYNYLNK